MVNRQVVAGAGEQGPGVSQAVAQGACGDGRVPYVGCGGDYMRQHVQ